MSGFNMDFFEVGNPMYLGISEELIEAQVNDAIDFIRNNHGENPTLEDIDYAIACFDIDYMLLPSWLKAKFDEFDVK